MYKVEKAIIWNVWDRWLKETFVLFRSFLLLEYLNGPLISFANATPLLDWRTKKYKQITDMNPLLYIVQIADWQYMYGLTFYCTNGFHVR